jgi:hypothetical protein
MHTIAHVAFYIALTFAIGAFLVAIGVALYSYIALAAACDGIAYTGHGRTVVNKNEIEINWSAPLFIAALALVWSLIALGLHAI